MVATLIEPTESMTVTSLSLLIYSAPGSWKTSIAQTADSPLTLDFDRGAHRAFNRRAVLRFDNWSEAEGPDFDSLVQKHQTIVIDTIGRLLDMLSLDIISANYKHGSRTGGLTLQGFGVLKARFATWISGLRSAGKDIVMLAHEKEERDGDLRFMRPDIQGGSYTEVMKFTDLVGYLRVEGGKRILDFEPSDKHLGKNAANWDTMIVPDLKKSPDWLAVKLAEAKARIGQIAEASAALAKQQEEEKSATSTAIEWAEAHVNAKIAEEPTLDQLNEYLGELATLKLSPAPKAAAFKLLKEYAEVQGWEMKPKSKVFTGKEVAV